VSEPPEMTTEQQLEQAKRLLFEACHVLRNTSERTPIQRELAAIEVLEKCQRIYPRDYGRHVSETW
jgi:hypothetical protein